jgi:hypothetical protein
MPRKGVKKSDRRWIDPDTGEEWDSKFEWRVFIGLRSGGYRLRRCDESDSIAYNSSVKQGRCLECSATRVVQERIYTSDLYVVDNPTGIAGGSYLVECKGYFPGDKRSLFVAVTKQLQGVDLRIIFESNRQLKGTKQTPVSYIHKYCKNVVPGVWDKKTEKVTWYEKD